MTKKVPKKILRRERNFFVNLRKIVFGRPRRAAPRRRRRFFGTGGAPPPPTEIDRRAAADTMTSAHSSTWNCKIRVLIIDNTVRESRLCRPILLKDNRPSTPGVIVDR